MKPTTNQRKEQLYRYLHSFSCCCVRNLRNPRNSTKFELIAVQGHPRSLILVSIESVYATPISH